MALIGFSTGALCRDDLQAAVAVARDSNTRAIELSALRLRELRPLLDFVQLADLSSFTYVSVHAPTDYSRDQEREVAKLLAGVALERQWSVVVHPDCISDTEAWKPLDRWLTPENMDKRKPVGRTVEELAPFFEAFPSAAFCFDIGHAHQVDTSMTEAYRLLREFGARVCQLHVSEVSSSSKHARITERVLQSFLEVAHRLPPDVPVILETPVTPEEALLEMEKAARLLTTPALT